MDLDFVIGTLWDIAKNVLGNRVDAALFPAKEALQASSSSAQSVPVAEAQQRPLPLFKTFDAVDDLAQIVNFVEKPALHLLVEDAPSTHYNLAAIVLESQTTGQWYLFSRGRVALQGSGGGKHNLDAVLDRLRSRSAGIAAWVVDKTLLDTFESGHILWGAVRPNMVPLLSYLSKDHSWSEIQRRFVELGESAP